MMRICAAMLATTAIAASVRAVPPNPPALQRQPVLEEFIPAANPPIRLVRGARIQFEPGQPTGLHSHPVSVAGVVTEGSFKFQRQGEPPRVLKAGDAFFEPANQVIEHFDNASNSQPAAIMAFYLTDTAERPLIDMLSPR